MMTTIAQRMKATEKQTVCKKLMAAFKKRYKGSPTKTDRPILEMMLFAICQENATLQAAEDSYKNLHSTFHDLNEIRVSSITELERALKGLPDPEWKALRVRSVLHHIFETHFSYSFEPLRRKTHDRAGKQLGKIDHLSTFVRNATLQEGLGSHVIPLDDRMTLAVIWLGLVSPNSTPAAAADAVKPGLRKNDGPVFCHLLRQFATDPLLVRSIEALVKNAPDEGFDPATAASRLADLFKNPSRAAKAAAAKAAAAKKSAPKKAAPKKATAKKATPKKATAKKATPKKTTAKKATPKKTTAKKTATKKPVVTKKTAKKATTKKKAAPAKKKAAGKAKKSKASR